MRHILHGLPRTPSQPNLVRLHPPPPVLLIPARASSTATAASPSQPPAKRTPATAGKKKPALTLEHFLLRQRVLGLYRTIARALTALPRDSAQRRELRAHARAEFERHREVADAGKIRYLVSTGKTEFDGMKRYLEEMGR